MARALGTSDEPRNPGACTTPERSDRADPSPPRRAGVHREHNRQEALSRVRVAYRQRFCGRQATRHRRPPTSPTDVHGTQRQAVCGDRELQFEERVRAELSPLLVEQRNIAHDRFRLGDRLAVRPDVRKFLIGHDLCAIGRHPAGRRVTRTNAVKPANGELGLRQPRAGGSALTDVAVALVATVPDEGRLPLSALPVGSFGVRRRNGKQN